MARTEQALKKQKEQEEKLAAEKARRQKEQDKLDRERIKKKLEQVGRTCACSSVFPRRASCCLREAATFREKSHRNIAQDKLERLAAKGIKPEEAAAVAKVEKPPDPFKERKLNLSSKLRDIIGFHRNDPTTPNPATKALETAVSLGVLFSSRDAPCRVATEQCNSQATPWWPGETLCTTEAPCALYNICVGTNETRQHWRIAAPRLGC